MTNTDNIYCKLINTIAKDGETVTSRNGETRRLFTLPSITFDTTPLVTVRKTAWKKAILEMEWFLSGKAKCPEKLLDWWDGQLNAKGMYLGGYGEQLRSYATVFDQIEALISGMRSHPFGRRHVITTWDPYTMSRIQCLNQNERTPTTCHTTIAQFFITKPGYVSMHSYQRSADMLLGVPHNWIQSWALLLWVAEQVEGIADKMIWTFGDAHIYMEESHMEVVHQLRFMLENNFRRVIRTARLMSKFKMLFPAPRLAYFGKLGDPFRATDFDMIGDIPSPIILTRPKLL